MTTQPAHFPNIYVERTHQAALNTAGDVLSHCSTLSRVSLYHLNKGRVTLDRIGAVLGVVHELATAPDTSAKALTVPACACGLVVPWNDIQHNEKINSGVYNL
mmetsp:Transcript_28661/g.40294  ORF Transcript_28661/g.40294 Transcript_28661/m.40294 type:complete len:103 (+) Transcript_28661:597-905(+)